MIEWSDWLDQFGPTIRQVKVKDGSWIFVFPCANGQGVTRAQQYAIRFRGFEPTAEKGMSGDAYGLWFWEGSNGVLSLREEEYLKEEISQFIEFAKTRPELKFQVAKLDMGAEETVALKIRSAFESIPGNVMRPGVWVEGLSLGMIVGEEFDDYEGARTAIIELIKDWEEGGSGRSPMRLVACGESVAGLLIQELALEIGVDCLVIENNESMGSKASELRDRTAIWACNNMIVFRTSRTKSTDSLIDVCSQWGVRVKHVSPQKVCARKVESQADRSPIERGHESRKEVPVQEGSKGKSMFRLNFGGSESGGGSRGD